MRRSFALLVFLCVALAPAALAQGVGERPKQTLVRAGRLLDVKAGRYLANQGILIEGETIKLVGPFDAVRAQAPGDATLLDLRSATVLPGLIDCHAHLLDSMDAPLGPSDSLILTINKISPAKRALLGAAMAREDLEAGFTTVRVVGHSGIDGDVALRDAINSGWLVGPRIVAAARKLTPPGGQAVPVQQALLRPILEQEFLPVNGPEEARRAVRENLRVGADLIKVVVDVEPVTLDLDEMKAIVEEAHRSGVKVAAHATTRRGIQAAVDAGVDSIEHADEATDEQLQAMRNKGIFLDPTEWTRAEILDLVNRTAPLAPAARAELEAWLDRFVSQQKSVLERSRKFGLKVVAGSDMWWRYPGKTRGQASLLTLEAMEEHGMPPAEVLRAATSNAAELLGWQNRVGSIEAGKSADMIALAGDPLRTVKELEKTTLVMKGGVVVRREQ